MAQYRRRRERGQFPTRYGAVLILKENVGFDLIGGLDFSPDVGRHLISEYEIQRLKPHYIKQVGMAELMLGPT